MITKWQQKYLKIEERKVDEPILLELQTDIYCLTFLKFIQIDDPILHRDLVLKCCLTFLIQILLCVLVLSETEGFSDIYMGSTPLNASRILCSFLLHMTIVTEIRASLEMMLYVLNNPKDFHGNGAWFVFFICGLKLCGAFFAELINIWKMGQQSQIEDVVKDFIAFSIIAEIDDLIA